MRRFAVVTPEFDYMEVIIGGQGPVHNVYDYIEVEAETAKEAISLGVGYMLTHNYSDGDKYQYVHDQRSDGLCPYTGVKAEELFDEEEV